MTFRQNSSNRGPLAGLESGVDSLGAVFHPHAIEIQDFAYYALIIDVRPLTEYQADHIPGAVRLEPPEASEQTPSEAGRSDGLPRAANPIVDMPEALVELVEHVGLDQSILIYCGRGGRVSQPLAAAIRSRRWTVDVLLGGWINYRRWVQAGLETLPRLVDLRIVACSLGSEGARVLRALRETGQQVLDICMLARWRRHALHASLGPQPTQAWFESQLLQCLREFDPRRPVWVEDVGPRIGALSTPGALVDALRPAPTARVEIPVDERVRCWREDEPLLLANPMDVIDAVSALVSKRKALSQRMRRAAASGLSDPVLKRLLIDYVDRSHQEQADQASGDRPSMSPLLLESLVSQSVVEAIRLWLPAAAQSRAPG